MEAEADQEAEGQEAEGQEAEGLARRLRDGYVRTERVGTAHEVLYFRLLEDTVGLVDRLSQQLREIRPDCIPDPVMAVGDVLAVGLECAGAATWRTVLRVGDGAILA